MKDTFSSYHPAITMIFFTFVILAAVFLYHPVLVAISFAAGMAYSIYLKGKKAVKLNLKVILPMMLIAIAINILFNHQGDTVIGSIFGWPVTLEALGFGVVVSAVIASMVMWFSCYNVVMTSDKFVYLFGRVIPSLSLILSMVFRFIPKFEAQTKKIIHAQKYVGKDVASGTWKTRARNGALILSIMASWALENSAHTVDSMKSRGHRLKGRTAYALYRFDARDRTLLIIMIVLLALFLGCVAARVLYADYFPSFEMNEWTWLSGLLYAVYAVICWMPLILNVKEDIVWHLLRSRV
ncbi:MAG: energy-coupling factor transporter transmembrane component T [Christensenellales bacterium]|jgi:energy-coupling factor transport system permease protein